MRTALFLTVLASFIAGSAKAWDVEDVSVPFDSPQLSQSCRKFWNQILSLPTDALASANLTRYPTRGQCVDVPILLKDNHDRYGKHCDPSRGRPLPSAEGLYDCAEATVIYRINLSAWKNRQYENLEQLSTVEALQVLFGLQAYTEREEGLLARYSAALQIARRLSESVPNVENAGNYFSALNRLRNTEINIVNWEEEIAKASAIFVIRLQGFAWYPNREFRGIAESELESVNFVMNSIGKGKAFREQLISHPNTRYWGLYFEGCSRTGTERAELFREANQLPQSDGQIQKFIDRQPADQCRSIQPRFTRTIEAYALALGIEPPIRR